MRYTGTSNSTRKYTLHPTGAVPADSKPNNLSISIPRDIDTLIISFCDITETVRNTYDTIFMSFSPEFENIHTVTDDHAQSSHNVVDVMTWTIIDETTRQLVLRKNSNMPEQITFINLTEDGTCLIYATMLGGQN